MKMIKKILVSAVAASMLEVVVAESSTQKGQTIKQNDMFSQNLLEIGSEQDTHRQGISTILEFLKGNGSREMRYNEGAPLEKYTYKFPGSGPTEHHRSFEYKFIYSNDYTSRSLTLVISNKNKDGTLNLIVLVDKFVNFDEIDGKIDEIYRGISRDGKTFLLPINFTEEINASMQGMYESLVTNTATAIKENTQK